MIQPRAAFAVAGPRGGGIPRSGGRGRGGPQRGRGSGRDRGMSRGNGGQSPEGRCEKCYLLVTRGSAASPVRYDGGRSTSASGRSSAATRSAYPGSQVASSSARMRSSSGRSRRRAAAGRRREERHRQERHREERPCEDCCREGNGRGRTGPDSRTPRCRRCASEMISTANTATVITPGIIHSPPVPVQLGYARLNHATPGTSGKWFMTESAEPAARSPSDGAALPGPARTCGRRRPRPARRAGDGERALCAVPQVPRPGRPGDRPGRVHRSPSWRFCYPTG